MENNHLLQQAKTMSFLQLIDEYNIFIPVIQRDYAQGRISDDVTKIRKDFVRDLLLFICDNTQPHYIDFVYGTIEHKEGHVNSFIPLDGQQRLTTLFLLHWYLSGISNNAPSFLERINEKFEYATRKSSTEFCRRLISHNIWEEFNKRREEKPDIKLSEIIEDQGWFFSVWKQDPTVHGMLIMLDEIHQQVTKEKYDTSILYNNLFENDIQTIVFQWQPLDGYTLTDDLYIKMNARGLKLTDFEIFKALYELSLKSLNTTTATEFSKKIDGEWCDFLWQRKGELQSTDKIMERIIRIMIAIGYARKVQTIDDNTQEILNVLFSRNNKKMLFSYSRYRELGVFHDPHSKEQISDVLKSQEEYIAQNINEAFSIICNTTTSPLNCSVCYPWYNEQKEITKILQSDIETLLYDDFIYFYAFVAFSARYKGDASKEELKQWMRYIHNLSNATIVNNSSQLANILRSIDQIISNMDDKPVLEWIAYNNQIASFPHSQSYEESIKAQLILWGNNNNCTQWKEFIELNEQDEYMRGQIGFLLYTADVLFLDKSINPESNQKALDIFKTCSYKARQIFTLFKESSNLLKEEHLLERALLTKNMYLKTASAGRLNFCNQPYDRDNSWRKMLEITPKTECSAGIKAMKELLMTSWQDNNMPIVSLNKIIKEYLKDSNNQEWYSPFIRDYWLLDLCHQGYIHKNGNTIILLRESQMNHYHSELQSIILYFRLKETYNFINYNYVRSGEENPGMYYKLLINSIKATIYIYFQDAWYIEIWDEHMYYFDTERWNSIKDELLVKLGIQLNNPDQRIKIEEQQIENILRKNTENLATDE